MIETKEAMLELIANKKAGVEFYFTTEDRAEKLAVQCKHSIIGYDYNVTAKYLDRYEGEDDEDLQLFDGDSVYIVEAERFYLSDALDGWYFDVQDLSDDWLKDEAAGDYYTIRKEEYDWMVKLSEAYQTIAEEGRESELEFLNDYDDVIGFAENLKED